MPPGNCHFCGKPRELIDSHVWPKFAYKRFVANQDKGGQFADLSTLTLTNRQYTRYWFCRSCEDVLGQTETYVAQLCDRMEKAPRAIHAYDERLLRFVVSISWRSLKLHHENMKNSVLEMKWPGVRLWRQYLLGEVARIEPYNQHVFNIIGAPIGLDKALGGQPDSDHTPVISQIGPLLMVGHLKPQGLTAKEKLTWNNTKVGRSGSIIQLRRWDVSFDFAEHDNITMRFAHKLAALEQLIRYRKSIGPWVNKKG